MGGYFGKNGGVGGGSVSSGDIAKYLSYNPDSNRIESRRAIETTLNSFYLSELHKISSGAENVFFTNLNSGVNFYPAWGGLKNHAIVENRGADGIVRPSIRIYKDMITVKPYGDPAGVGSVAYGKAATMLGNHSVLGQEFIVTEPVAASDWLIYQVWYGSDDTGVQAYEQKFTGTAYAAGATVNWWFTHPVEGHQNTPIYTCIKIAKGKEDAEKRLLQVRPSTLNAANHYSNIRIREFYDMPIHGYTKQVEEDEIVFLPCDHAVNPEIVYPYVPIWFQFGNTIERDQYFQNNPGELQIGIWIDDGINYAQWDGVSWNALPSEKTVKLTVPLAFKSNFRVYDYKTTFSSTAKCVVDFTAYSQGTVTMGNAGDDIEFTYITGEGWYLYDRVSNVK
ncbi:hypothetical protein, partial [Shewanella cutis]